jgi:hypothetical protein
MELPPRQRLVSGRASLHALGDDSTVVVSAVRRATVSELPQRQPGSAKRQLAAKPPSDVTSARKPINRAGMATPSPPTAALPSPVVVSRLKDAVRHSQNGRQLDLTDGTSTRAGRTEQGPSARKPDLELFSVPGAGHTGVEPTIADDVEQPTPPGETVDDDGDDGEGDEVGEDLQPPTSEQLAAEATFAKKVSTDEPLRKAPAAVARELVGPHVWLSVSPFPHRMHSIVFPPADRPWEGDPQANASGVYVTPHSLDPAPNYPGRRKRIGRKGKFESLLWSIPEGAVRFSAVTAIFGSAGFVEAEEDDPMWSVRWCKRVEPEEYKALLPNQKINHFPGTWGIGRKDNLHKHLTQSANKYGRDVYNFHPEAWILPQDALALQNDMNAKLHCPANMTDNVYIIKQVASACGRRMRLLCKGSVPKGKWIVQRYIHDPLLIYGYKFDLRIYVVVTSYYPLRLYVYEEGLVRFATSPYPVPKNGKGMKVRSATAHLTNYSVNKKNTEAFVNPKDDGGEDEERGSKWVLTTVKRYFEKNGLDWNGTWAKIEDVIIKTVLAVEPIVVNQMRGYFGVRANGQVNNCFELYGFDVLLRQDLTPILMEVNIMPSLATRCSLLDQRVKANMIADMMTLVGAYSMAKSHKSRPKEDSKPLGHPFLDSLSVAEAEVVCQAEEENLRRMHYKRLFPTATAFDKYKHLFIGGRQLNGVLMEWERAKATCPPPWLSATPSQQSMDDED